MSDHPYILGTTRRQTHQFWNSHYAEPPDGFQVHPVWEIPYSYLRGPYRNNSFLVTLKTFVPTRHIDLYEVKNSIVTNKTPWVVILESILPLYNPRNRKRYLFAKCMDLLSGEHCRKILFWSELARKCFVEHLTDWCAALQGKFELVYPAVSIPEGPMERFADGKVHVLFAGYAFFRKGGRELVRAFTSLNRDDAVLHLVTNFTPDGFMTDTTQRDAAEARAGVQRRPNILVHENMGQKEVIALMRKCHVFCLPTFWDTFGLVCLEAMSCGLPCVVTNVGALEEVIENGGNGFVVRLSVNGFGHLVRTGDKPFDNRAAVVEAREFLVAELAAKLTALLDDPQMRAKMGKRSLELCRAKFDFQERRKRMGEIYRTALGVSPDG